MSTFRIDTATLTPATTTDRMPSCEGCGARPDRLDFDDSGGFLCARCARAIAGAPTAADRKPIRLIGRRAAMASRLETKSE